MIQVLGFFDPKAIFDPPQRVRKRKDNQRIEAVRRIVSIYVTLPQFVLAAAEGQWRKISPAPCQILGYSRDRRPYEHHICLAEH